MPCLRNFPIRSLLLRVIESAKVLTIIFSYLENFFKLFGARGSLKYESIQESSQLILPIAHIIKTELIALGTGNNKLDKKRDKSIVSVLLSCNLKILKPKEENDSIHCQWTAKLWFRIFNLRLIIKQSQLYPREKLYLPALLLSNSEIWKSRYFRCAKWKGFPMLL